MPVIPTATPYMALADFQLRAVGLSAADIQIVEGATPGKVAALMAALQSWLDSQLRKRYAAPFSAPVPEIVLRWLTTLLTVEVYLCRGVNAADDDQMKHLQDLAAAAKAEIAQAANSRDGLFDLPLNDDANASAVSAGGPLGHSTQNPYEWQDEQIRAVRDWDGCDR